MKTLFEVVELILGIVSFLLIFTDDYFWVFEVYFLAVIFKSVYLRKRRDKLIK